MYLLATRRAFKRHHRSLLLIAIIVLAGTLFHPGRANAATAIPKELSDYATQEVVAGVNDGCNVQNYYAYQTEWLSKVGSPTENTVVVPDGATSVPLQLNYLTYRCKDTAPGSPPVIAGSFEVTSTVTTGGTNPAAANGLVGFQGDLLYKDPGTIYFRTNDPYPLIPSPNNAPPFNQPFNFPTEALHSNRSYTIRIFTHGTITRDLGNGNKSYACALIKGEQSGIGVHTANGPHDFRNCNSDYTDLDMNVIVTPPLALNCAANPVTMSGNDALTNLKMLFHGTYTGTAPSNPPYPMTYSIVRSDGSAVPAGSVTAPAPPGPVPYTTSGNEKFDTTPPGINVNLPAGVYNVTFSINNLTCSQEIDIVNKPYFKIYGGDISAGGGFEPACTPDTTAEIKGQNKGAADGYNGATVQYGAFAVNLVKKVATAWGGGITNAAPPNGLSFANTPASTDPYGGNFGTLPCIKNYFVNGATGNTPLGTNKLTGLDGTFYTNGSTTGQALTAKNGLYGQVNANKHVIIYADGDVYINDNIVYNGAWDLDHMPSFQLIVRGRIFVSNTVTELDGSYISMPTSAYTIPAGGTVPANQTGTIYTCTEGAQFLDLYDYCKNPLTVHGSFVAKQVEFLRSNGTLQAARSNESADTCQDVPVPASCNIAEVFKYSPIVWLNQQTNTGLTPSYDSITSLPPIL